jgi:3D (Asp-Asp-Asp) domain-containing protein
MKCLFITVSLALLLAGQTFAREEFMLARITGYWRGEGSGQCAASNSARLRVGHCAVDPKRIPYGSKVIFPDADCVAVDTGPAVVSRKSARFCGHTTAERNAIVVDRFFETRKDAVAWTNAHPQFMTLRVVMPETKSNRLSTQGHAQKIKHSGMPATASHGALTLAPLNPFPTSFGL